MKITILSVCLLAFLFTFPAQTFAANFVVNDATEDSNGLCNDYCSLRDAIIAANNSPYDDTISFDPNVFRNNYVSVTLNRELVINNTGRLTIDGANVSGMTIDGGAGTNRIFRVEGATLLLQNLTLTGGNGLGAAVFANGGTLLLNSVNIRDNAGDGSFGAIYLAGGSSHQFVSSSIYNNTGFNDCAAIYVSGATLSVYNITVSGNSTLAAGLGAGAVCMVGASYGQFRNATIFGNTANGAGNLGGGGIFIQDTTLFDLGNSIVAGNTSPNRGPDLYIFNGGTAAFRTARGNVIGDNSGNPAAPNTTVFPIGNPNANGDKVGTAGNVINPLLAPLANNGGTTLTRALLAGSPAIDAGSNAAGFTSYDQRGALRIQDGNDDGTAIIDSGAFEYPAFLTVTRSDDRNNSGCAAGDCSLREAVNAANTLPGADRINFAAGLSGQTILLSPGLGQLNITGSLTIDASAATNLSVSGGGAVSVFRISEPSATVVMTGFRITGGNADYFRNGGDSNGGGILNYGDLTLNNMLLQGNRSNNIGGGIYSDFLSDSRLGNRLTINGGSINDGTAIVGGAIAAEETVINLTNVTISGNQASSSGGGIEMLGGTLNITGGSVTGNTALYNNGGGIATYDSIPNSDGTVTYFDAPRITIINASITNNRSLPDATGYEYSGGRRGNGGGIYMETAVLTMINSTVSGNFGQRAGGGISTFNGGSYNITGTTLSGNSTGRGSPGFGYYGGGALFSQSGLVNISNSTISGNRSNSDDYNRTGNGGGGGISTSSVINLRNVTIANNRAPNGPGGGINTFAQPGYPGTVSMGNTIVANNSNVADNGITYTYNPDVSGTFVSQGFNLVRTRGSSSGYVASDLPDGSNPLLETLANNGGSTQTHRLLAGSQAIDRGSNALAVNPLNNTALTTDQRGTGFTRIRDGNLDGTATVDIGAYEVQTGMLPPADLTVVKSHTGNFAQGQTGARYTITVTNNGGSATGGTVTAADTLPSGLTATAITGSGWVCTLGTLSCTRSDALAVGASYPPITLTVNVATNAPASVTNTATVSGGGEANTVNNTASDATTVNAVADLTIVKSHAGNFTRGDTGKTYSITVTNSGGTATSGTVSVTDTLPSGLTATAIAGTGWACTLGTLSCTRSDALAANSSYPAITLTVNVTNNAPSSVTNTATVSGGGETNTANNTANDVTTVFSAASYTISGQVTNGGQGLFGVTVTLSGGVTAKTDAAGNYSFTNVAAGGSYTLTPSLSGYNFTPPSATFNNLIANQSNANFATSIVSYEGDVATRPGGDGSVNISDSAAVDRIIALLDAQPANGSEFQRADAAPRVVGGTTTLGDGFIDVRDLVQTGRYSAVLDPLTPAGGATTAQAPAGITATSTATVSAGSVTASNTTAAVPIQLTTTGDVEAIQFSIVYDQTKLSLPANLLTAFTNRYPNTTFTFNTATPGRIGVVAYQPLDGVSVFPAGTNTLFNINFMIIGTPSGTTSIDFGNSPIPQRASNTTADAVTVATTAGTVTFSGQNQIVNTLADHDDGDCGTTDCTLREAVKYATAGGNITFSVTGTITLTGGEIAIAKNLTITGPASSPGITVSGNNATRIFTITGSSTVVNISALTLSGGNGVSSGGIGSGNGGAIYIDFATVRLTNSTLSGNSVTGNGGAVRNSGNLTVTNSTFSANNAAITGGAIRTGGTLNITNSTISGNGSPSGGGIYSIGTINLTGATIAYNTAATSGGGVYNSGGTANLLNTVVAKNINSAVPDFSGAITSSSTFNLIGDGTGMTGIADAPSTGNQVGTSAMPIDPKLDPTLALNGGTTLNHALLTDSPAIDKGSATGTDQRGLTRPSDNPSIPNAAGGNGADIGAFEVQMVPPASAADLTIGKSHTGNFTQGDSGKTYSITVSNIGSGSTSGTVTVVDTLPTGLTATGISGTGWTCNPLPSLTCTRTDALAAAGIYPAITVTVNVAANASASVNNTVTVSGGGESNTTNNTATDPTTINAAATYSISGQVIYGTTPSASAARGVPGVTLNASGTPPATAASNLSGIYQLSGLGSGAYTVTPSKSGDVNHITANDALLIQQYGAYAANLTPNQLIAADTNNDNQVNTTDALYIQQYLAYVNTQTPNIIEQWKFLPGAQNYTLSGSLANQNYTAVLVGEVDGDWVAPGGTSSAPQQAASSISETEDAAAIQTNANEINATETNATDINVNQLGIEKPRQEDKESIKYALPSAAETVTTAAVSSVTVSLPTNATSSTGTSVTIPITVSPLPALADANVVKTYAFNVQYDGAVLQYTNADTTGTLSSGVTVVCGQPPADPNTTNRIVACNYVNPSGITGAGTLLKLNFTVIGTSGQQSAVTFVGTTRQASPFIFNTGDPQAVTGNGSFTVTGTTAATVSVGGRVLTASGRGIRNVRITLTDSSGKTRTAVSTAFGYYRFDNVTAGETYIITARGKHYEFSQSTRVINVNEDAVDINFAASSE